MNADLIFTIFICIHPRKYETGRKERNAVSVQLLAQHCYQARQQQQVDIDWQNGWSDKTVAKDKIAPYPTAATVMSATGGYVILKPQSDISEWKFADGKTQKVKNTNFIPMT